MNFVAEVFDDILMNILVNYFDKPPTTGTTTTSTTGAQTTSTTTMTTTAAPTTTSSTSTPSTTSTTSPTTSSTATPSTTSVITSPGFPENYDKNLDLTWLIEVPTGQRIEIKFSDFDVEYRSNCGSVILYT